MPARIRLESVARAALVVAWIAAPFAGAGTLAWAGAWIYLGLLAAGLAGHASFVARFNPALRQRRARVGVGTPWFDVAWIAVFWAAMLVAPAVAGVEIVRYGRAPLSWAVALAGMLLLGVGVGISAGAMATNPFFEGTVRIQPGQRVVDQGPYGHLRHPGYAGLALWALATPLVLRSRWALAPAGFTVPWIVLRTALEDAFLRRRLAGYDAYARRVRSRLVPGIW